MDPACRDSSEITITKCAPSLSPAYAVIGIHKRAPEVSSQQSFIPSPSCCKHVSTAATQSAQLAISELTASIQHGLFSIARMCHVVRAQYQRLSRWVSEHSQYGKDSCWQNCQNRTKHCICATSQEVPPTGVMCSTCGVDLSKQPGG